VCVCVLCVCVVDGVCVRASARVYCVCVRVRASQHTCTPCMKLPGQDWPFKIILL
jgi:hypothetical protein